jgi:hypothetical protein
MDSDLSLAEEGEGTPLMAERREVDESRWFQGPVFKAGVKLAVLFAIFAGVVFGTFYYGLPGVDPYVPLLCT